jgi:hypothetical protein
MDLLARTLIMITMLVQMIVVMILQMCNAPVVCKDSPCQNTVVILLVYWGMVFVMIIMVVPLQNAINPVENVYELLNL